MEIWKTIEGFENYEVSNLGNIKSSCRKKINQDIFLKKQINSNGYYCVNLYYKGNRKNAKIHQLVAIQFLNHKPNGYKLVVNHKDFNKLNNNVDNLEIVTQRENANQKHLKSSSQYIGVHWCKNRNKWTSFIRINNKKIFLGRFIKEYDAYIAYKNALNTITP